MIADVDIYFEAIILQGNSKEVTVSVLLDKVLSATNVRPCVQRRTMLQDESIV